MNVMRTTILNACIKYTQPTIKQGMPMGPVGCVPILLFRFENYLKRYIEDDDGFGV